MRSTIKQYYLLTKPGIVYGNLLAAIGGYFLASSLTNSFEIVTFVYVSVGLALVIASACVFNNYYDRSIDSRMQRTKNRSLATGSVSKNSALIYGTVLGVIGTILLLQNNVLTASSGLFGLFAYVVLYGIGKRNSVHGTLIGSISGAVPPVVGYVAVMNQIDMAAIILFLIMVCWQMPHFYAIAIFRQSDYRAANIPVLPIVNGLKKTEHEIIGYAVSFFLATSLLTIYGYTGYVYLIAMSIVSIYWLSKIMSELHNNNQEKWARSVFRSSLTVLLLFCGMISIGALLP